MRAARLTEQPAHPPDLYQKGNPVDDQTVPELTGYQQQAAELRRVAEVLASAAEGAKRPYFTLTIIVAEDAPHEVEALAERLLGKPGRVVRSGDSWFHLAQDYTAERALAVQSKVAGPPDERDAELDQLRARVAELEAGR